MKIQITKHFDFEASHFLPKVPEGHKCGRMHGHSYTVTLGFQCHEDELDEQGFVTDYAHITTLWAPIFEAVDHRTLNEVKGLGNPSTEILAKWIYNTLKTYARSLAYGENPHVHRAARLLWWVEVRESKTTTCRYPVA